MRGRACVSMTRQCFHCAWRTGTPALQSKHLYFEHPASGSVMQPPPRCLSAARRPAPAAAQPSGPAPGRALRLAGTNSAGASRTPSTPWACSRGTSALRWRVNRRPRGARAAPRGHRARSAPGTPCGVGGAGGAGGAYAALVAMTTRRWRREAARTAPETAPCTAARSSTPAREARPSPKGSADDGAARVALSSQKCAPCRIAPALAASEAT